MCHVSAGISGSKAHFRSGWIQWGDKGGRNLESTAACEWRSGGRGCRKLAISRSTKNLSRECGAIFSDTRDALASSSRIECICFLAFHDSVVELLNHLIRVASRNISSFALRRFRGLAPESDDAVTLEINIIKDNSIEDRTSRSEQFADTVLLGFSLFIYVGIPVSMTGTGARG